MAALSHPPGPKGRFLTGNVQDLMKDPLGFLTRCARDYGDIVYLRMGGKDVYLINEPELIETVLASQHRSFVKDVGYRSPVMRRLFGNGLLTSEGDLWLRQRKILQPGFHRDRLVEYCAVMVEFAQRMLDGWRDGEERDVHNELMRLTLQVVTRSLFGREVTNAMQEVSAASGVIMDQFVAQASPWGFLSTYLPTPRTRRFEQVMRKLDRLVLQAVREDAGNLARSDVTALLLEARDETGQPLSEKQIRDDAVTLLVAGHDTTALALTWACTLLAQSPDAEAKLAAELRTVLGGRPPTLDDVPALEYTERVVKEAMRLYPPAWIVGREAVTDVELGSVRVKRGAQIVMSQWVMHRDARFFHRPEAFEPDRWADDLEKRLPRFAYFPFGAGPRICIGRSFATNEAILVLATIAQRFQLRLVADQTVIPYPSITLQPRGGVRMILESREAASLERERVAG